MKGIERRDFLVRTGLALSAALLSPELLPASATPPLTPKRLDTWERVRA